ncbi:hypothetical protein M408DRAFT_25984 [Serendipita vermifera MAFF 305830]|uniref:Uncharacterized protein n=1 Tax=Serendipita vermifera MAFF 305830 TaxID=933852 RepID=A0A0C3AM63_SERVB|nr:hypothetical protein M408DRAFT_25984 [Serendipita vermifera MAFF 305830]
MQQAYMQNPDLDPRQCLFRLLLDNDHVGGFPSRFRPVGVTIAPAPEFATLSKSRDCGAYKLWYRLTYIEEVTGTTHELISAKTVPSDWKEELKANDGVFDAWSYIFSYTCFAHSLTKRAAVLRANLLAEASRIGLADEGANGFFGSLLIGKWEDMETASGVSDRGFCFELRKLWGCTLDVMNVWDVMDKSGVLTRLLENSCGVVDYRGSLEVIKHSTTA